MKKVFVLLLVIIFNVSAYCQIGVTSAVAPVKKTEVVVFDSTKNFLGYNNVMSYIDQTLFVLPKAKSSQKYGYRNFFEICEFNLKRFLDVNYKHYGQDAASSEFSTRYEDLAMTYWHVDTIVSARDYYHYDQIYYLFYLSNVNEPESKCAFKYDPRYERSFPFIVLSHYNYLKEKYIGKQFIVDRNLLHKYDLSTGDSIIVTDDTKTIWTAEDLNVISNENGDQDFGILLKQGNKRTYVTIDFFERRLGRRIIEKKEWDKLVATYGLDMVKTAFHGDIEVGMSRELLILAWGEPKSINKASYGNQYVYDSDYVYLKNGKVTGYSEQGFIPDWGFMQNFIKNLPYGDRI